MLMSCRCLLGIGMIKRLKKEKFGLKDRRAFIGELGLNSKNQNKCMMKMELK